MKGVRKKQTRFSVAVAVAAIAMAIAVSAVNWRVGPLVGWDIGAITLLVLLWHDFAGHSVDQAAAIARRDDMNRSISDILLILASVASVGAVAVLLLANDGKRASLFDVGFGLISIVISWAVVHSVYMLLYAAQYYQHGEEGGIDFNSDVPPHFIDFAYLAFTIGMTYQVSDTSFQTSAFRRLALHHALLSFIFGTAIIATTINFIASLAH